MQANRQTDRQTDRQRDRQTDTIEQIPNTKHSEKRMNSRIQQNNTVFT